MIVKSRHASNFTTLPNEIFKSGLTIEAIGLLAYLISLPHDWIVYKTQLHNQLVGLGEKKLDRIFKELQKSGYIISTEVRTKGKITYNHIVYDKPFNGETVPPSQGSGLPPTAEPYTANVVLQSTNRTKETITNNIKIAATPYFDILAAINSNIEIYKAVMANKKNSETTHDSFLAYLRNEFPVYEFRDTNHFVNALRSKLERFEGQSKKSQSRRENNNPNNGMVY